MPLTKRVLRTTPSPPRPAPRRSRRRPARSPVRREPRGVAGSRWWWGWSLAMMNGSALSSTTHLVFSNSRKLFVGLLLQVGDLLREIALGVARVLPGHVFVLQCHREDDLEELIHELREG